MQHMDNRICLPADFLRTGGTLAQLEEKWAIKAKRHPLYNNLVMLKYSQLDSPFTEPMVRQSRGLILDESKHWVVVARPMDKFFNYGEEAAAPMNWSVGCAVQEKLDGSLMILYWYGDAWHVASSGTPDAGGLVGDWGFSFAKLFWMVFYEKGYQLPSAIQRAYTFMFELMSPYNRVVVDHQGADLKLIAVRNTWTGQELHPKHHVMYDAVQEFPLTSMDDVLKTFGSMDPLKQEGYVVVDRKFNRIKVKHPGYVAIHRMKEGFGPKHILEVVRAGETSELTTHFPEWKDDFARIQTAYDILCEGIEIEFARISSIETTRDPGKDGQKAFAAEAVKSKCSGVLFGLRSGRHASVRDALKVMQIDALMDVLGVKNTGGIHALDTVEAQAS